MKNTFLKASASRGSQVIEEPFPSGLPKATIGSDGSPRDRWAAQLKITSNAKQLCLAHLQRDLILLEESEKSPWATHCRTLLHDALKLNETAHRQGKAWRKDQQKVYELENRLNRLLLRPIDGRQFEKTHTFQKSMVKYRDCLLVFSYNLEVPPDNNGSERAIRNVKVKQKVFGQFKSGQSAFCVLRSVIDTLKKPDLDVFDVFTYLAQIMASPAT